MELQSSACSVPGIRVSLVVTGGPHKGAIFEFDRHDTFLIGRVSHSHLCLRSDMHFSRHHLRMEIRPPECLLIDLGSRNGTFINGTRVREAFLKDGDVISGGKTQIRVSIQVPGSSTAVGQGATVLEGLSAQANGAEPTKLAGIGRLMLQPLPGYELSEELGQGSMGVVYRALQRATGRTVAVKLIIPRHDVSAEPTQLFIREASTLQRLEHPHIVHCHEFGFAAGQFFLVMEYVPTVTMAAALAQRSPWSKIRIPCAVVCQILSALEYAHRLSVVHRDIKPANILLMQNEAKLVAKLADFGLAKNYENAGFSALTREGEIRGTVAYMPPEQVIDCRYARPAADIYAAGATLYRFLTDEYPFDFGDRNKLAVILEDAPVSIRKRCLSVPRGLAEVIHRALAKDPQNRFSSAEGMRQALLPYASRRERLSDS